jgi:hypothetical protein
VARCRRSALFPGLHQDRSHLRRAEGAGGRHERRAGNATARAVCRLKALVAREQAVAISARIIGELQKIERFEVPPRDVKVFNTADLRALLAPAAPAVSATATAAADDEIDPREEKVMLMKAWAENDKKLVRPLGAWRVILPAADAHGDARRKRRSASWTGGP